jgi:hypothetical protein
MEAFGMPYLSSLPADAAMSGDRLHDIGYAGLATLLTEDRPAAVTER